MAGQIREAAHGKKYTMFLSDYGDGQFLESCFSYNTDITKTALIELSSQFGCQCDCSHCEYSYYFQGDASHDDLKNQILAVAEFLTVAEPGIDYGMPGEADRVVVSFSRMGEPLLNESILDFITALRELLPAYKYKLLVDLPTIMPSCGKDLLKRLRKTTMGLGIRLRLRPTIFATDDVRRKNIVGMDVIPLGEFPELLKDWSVVPIIELQPVEIGLILSFELGRQIGDARVRFRIRDMQDSLPVLRLGHKMITQRSNYQNHISHLKRGFERHGLKFVTEKREHEGISYPESLDPGRCFSLQMKETLVRRLMKLKAVKDNE